MKLYIYSILFAAALALPSAYAQTIDLGAEVPFDFRVGDTLMHAGKYTLHDSGSLLTVRSLGGQKKGVFRLTVPTSRTAATTDGKLVFNRYGSEYYLTTLWTPGSQEGRAVIKSKREKEVASQSMAVESAAIPVQEASR